MGKRSSWTSSAATTSKQIVKKLGKNMDARIGLLMFMRVFSKAAGAPGDAEGQVPNGLDWGWVACCCCVPFGLRTYMFEVLGGTVGFTRDFVREMFQKKTQ